MRTQGFVIAAAAALAGCDEGIDCTAEARSSVTVEVVDEDGAPVAGVEVVHAVDGGQTAACEAVGDDWVCGWEVAGAFEITASAPGFESATGSVDVGADECHVISETLTLTLAPACSDEPIPAVIATVTQSDGSAVTEPEVVWAPSYTSIEQVACEALDDKRYACAPDYQGGPVDVFVYADGFHHVFTEEIAIPIDEVCGTVVTQAIDVVMLPLE